MKPRYAIYFAPAEGTPLARFGETVLGRTATSPVRDIPAEDISAGSMAPAVSHRTTGRFPDQVRWLQLTGSAAHYGFHATLKAPFELDDGTSYQALAEAMVRFARDQAPVVLDGLAPRHLAGFAALTMIQQPAALSALAMQIVEVFEPYRQSLSAEDIERRRPESLTTRQLYLLQRYGYPYVDDEFRFHMTLYGQIDAQDEDYVRWLESLYAEQVPQTPLLDRIALYGQTDRHAPFVELLAAPLGRTS